MEKKQEKPNFKRPCDIKVTRTANPKTMLNKYLAEDVCKVWTEDFIDEDTKEVVSIERKEKLFERGLFLNKEAVSRIQFSIQAEEITEVKVSELRYDAERFIGTSLLPWEVSVSGGTSGKFLYLTRAQSAEQAITVATEYAGMYLGLNGWFSVKQVKYCDYNIVEDSDECIPEKAPVDYDADYEYFKVTVQSRFYCDLDDDADKENHVYIIKAQDVGQAKERITDYCSKQWEKELDSNPRCSFIVLKAQPYETDGIVPLEYCKLYRQESEADDK